MYTCGFALSIILFFYTGNNVSITSENIHMAVSAWFFGDSQSYGDIRYWDTSSVDNLDSLFFDRRSFNDDLSAWDVGMVTSMDSMFESASAFNGVIDGWNTSICTSMSRMFYNADAFNQALDMWDTGKVTTTAEMFYSSAVFNKALDAWDTSQITSMSQMFYFSPFNQPLNSWDTSKITSMYQMFYSSPFNQLLSKWDVSSVTSFYRMFYSSPFDQNLYLWRTDSVSSCSEFSNDGCNPPKFVELGCDDQCAASEYYCDALPNSDMTGSYIMGSNPSIQCDEGFHNPISNASFFQSFCDIDGISGALGWNGSCTGKSIVFYIYKYIYIYTCIYFFLSVSKSFISENNYKLSSITLLILFYNCRDQ